MQNKDLLKSEIPKEHRDAFLNRPESLDNATLCKVLTGLERKKLSYRDRLSTHGKKLVKHVLKEKIHVPFVKMWRQHFIDTMAPKTLPYMWQDCPEVYDVFGVKKPSKEECLQIIKERPRQSQVDSALI